MKTLCTYHDYRADLRSCPLEASLDTPLSHHDALADVFRVNVRRGMIPIDLSDALVLGYLYHGATKQTLPLYGEASGSTATLTLAEGCYATPGPFSLVLQVACGDVRHTILRVNGEIEETITGEVIDPADVLPDLPTLLTEIENLREATAEALSIAGDAEAAIAEAAREADEAIARTAQQTLDALTRAEASVTRAASLTAPAITETLEGCLPAVSDAAEDRPFRNLRLLGRSIPSHEPTPDAPATLISPGQQGSVTLRVCAQNLFPAAEPAPVVCTGSDHVPHTRWGYALHLPAGNYAIRPQRVVLSDSHCILVVINSAGGDFLDEIVLVDGSTPNTCILPLSEGDTLYFTGPDAGEQADAAAAFRDWSVQLVAGNVLYSGNLPASGLQAALNTPEGLRGVPASDRSTYLDDNGDLWLSDEIDLTRMVRIRRTGCIVLDGVTPGRCAYGKSSVSRLNTYNINTDDWGRHVTPEAQLLISHYPYNGTADSSSMARRDGVMICTMPGSMYISHNAITTLADYNAFLAQQHAAGTPVTILYELETPVEEPLTQAEADAALALHSLLRFTTLLCDGAWITGSYIADTKAYIDARFNELATQFILA